MEVELQDFFPHPSCKSPIAINAGAERNIGSLSCRHACGYVAQNMRFWCEPSVWLLRRGLTVATWRDATTLLAPQATECTKIKYVV